MFVYTGAGCGGVWVSCADTGAKNFSSILYEKHLLLRYYSPPMVVSGPVMPLLSIACKVNGCVCVLVRDVVACRFHVIVQTPELNNSNSILRMLCVGAVCCDCVRAVCRCGRARAGFVCRHRS